jgi:hypothetical protein
MDTGYLPKKAHVIYVKTPHDICKDRIMNRSDRAESLDPKVAETKMAWFKPMKKRLELPLPEGFQLVVVNGGGEKGGSFKQLQKKKLI